MEKTDVAGFFVCEVCEVSYMENVGLGDFIFGKVHCTGCCVKQLSKHVELNEILNKLKNRKLIIFLDSFKSIRTNVRYIFIEAVDVETCEIFAIGVFAEPDYRFVIAVLHDIIRSETEFCFEILLIITDKSSYNTQILVHFPDKRTFCLLGHIKMLLKRLLIEKKEFYVAGEKIQLTDESLQMIKKYCKKLGNASMSNLETTETIWIVRNFVKGILSLKEPNQCFAELMIALDKILSQCLTKQLLSLETRGLFLKIAKLMAKVDILQVPPCKGKALIYGSTKIANLPNYKINMLTLSIIILELDIFTIRHEHIIEFVLKVRERESFLTNYTITNKHSLSKDDHICIYCEENFATGPLYEFHLVIFKIL